MFSVTIIKCLRLTNLPRKAVYLDCSFGGRKFKQPDAISCIGSLLESHHIMVNCFTVRA